MSELAVRDVDTMTWAVMKEQAIMLVKSGFLPKAIDTPEKAMAVAIKGRELGLPMMQSITSINVIDGKPTISAELMAALVHQKIPNAILRCIETSNQICTYEAGRPADKILRMSFTWQDAVTAGVTGKTNWKQYPAAMLRARCCSAICRIVFPDAIMGCYTPDELGAITTEEGDITGEVINISTQKPPITPPQAIKEAADQQKPTGDTIQCIIEKVEKSPKSEAIFITAGGEKFSTFDKRLAEAAKALIGQLADLAYTTSGKYKNLTNISAAEAYSDPDGCTKNPVTCETSAWDGLIPYCGDEHCKYKVEDA